MNMRSAKIVYILSWILICFGGACASEPSQHDEHASPEPSSAYQGLAFISAPSFQSSALNFYDFKSGEILTILPGQAGDSWMAQQHDRLLFFNRNKEHSNFLILNSNQMLNTIQLEKPIPDTSYGDPHAVYMLPNDLFILANNTQGHITLANYKTGEIKQTFSSKTLDCGDICRPAGIVANADESMFYIINQGINQKYEFNHKQALFLFSFTKETLLTPIDQNGSQDSIQGIPLQLSNPLTASLTGQDDDNQKLQVIGTCTYFNLEGCKSGFEEVNLAKKTTSMLYDTTDSVFKGNGAIIPGETSDVFYAAMAKETKEAFIVRIDIVQKKSDIIHTFPEHSSGFGLLAYDDSMNKLYIGDSHVTREGSLQKILLDDVEDFINGALSELPSETIELQFPPTQGMFIP